VALKKTLNPGIPERRKLEFDQSPSHPRMSTASSRPARRHFTQALLLPALLAGLAAASPADTPPEARARWTAGTHARGFIDFEPGNDFVTGVDLGFAPGRVAGHDLGNRLELRLAYLTSRPEAASRNVLR
jgi:hypothetical protein